jgi:NADH-quinone oxidoreductase subunit D
MIRCTGLKYDIRLHPTLTYANYTYLNFISYISLHGDCYDRFLLRMNEMIESLFIINQIILKFLKKNTFLPDSKNFTIKKIIKKKKLTSKIFMENIIHHFKY